MLLTDLVVDMAELDWSIHVPLILHIVFLGLDHTRSLVHEHCKALLLNLLIMLADHKDHLTVAQVLLTCKTRFLGLGLNIPALPVLPHNFTGTIFILLLLRALTTIRVASSTNHF